MNLLYNKQGLFGDIQKYFDDMGMNYLVYWV